MHVLITGAAGNIGSYVASHARSDLTLRLLDQPGSEWGDLRAHGEVVEADITDLEAMKQACAGIDVVLHLAGNPNPSATWAELLPTNIVGTYTTFTAAKAAGCRRIVFASSIHAVSGGPPDVQVKTSEPVNPGDLYGVSKCFGEALGRYMAEQEGIAVIAVRIGAFQPIERADEPEATVLLDSFVSFRDLDQLLNLALRAEDVRFAIVHGLSDDRFKRLDISDTRALLGYDPQDDFAEASPVLRPALDGLPMEHDAGSEQQQSGLREDVAHART
jgi:NAD(P)-dependent dehydrogenase (short-subunit alcohol dehydrogenase family)